MRKAMNIQWAYLIASIACSWLFPLAVFADISQPHFNDGVAPYYYGSPTIYVGQNLGSGLSGTVTQFAFPLLQTHISGANMEASIECFTDDFYLTSCGKSATSTPIAYFGDTWATSTLATPYTLQPNRTYQLHVHLYGNNGGDFVYIFGSGTSAAWSGGAPIQGTASVLGTMYALAFNIDGVNIFSAPTGVSFGDVTQGLTASSTLFNNSASSTLALIAARCAGSSLIGEAICAATSFIFIPSTDVLDQFTSIPATAATRFPFSWIAGVYDEFQSLSATSTSQFATVSYSLGSIGIGSTTPMGNILPNITAFSKDTIETYIPSSTWALIQSILAALLWTGFVWFEYNRARRLAQHKV